MRYNIHEAKTHFSKIVAAVERGETVTICRNGKPVMECAPAMQSVKPFPFGDWGPPAKRGGDGVTDDHLVGPTDDDLLDEMGL